MPVAQRHQVAEPAIAALQAGKFDAAEKHARDVLKAHPKAVEANLVLAMAQYRATMHTLVATVMGGASILMGNTGYATVLRKAFVQAEQELGAVDDNLRQAIVADVNLDLCLACWEYDWNHSGEVDDNDRRLFEVEYDANGEPIPEDDPRRRPTFRFDVGDVHWARAMVAFQRAVFNLVGAFQYEDAVRGAMQDSETFRIPLDDPERIRTMRVRLLQGLDAADAARLAYLAEKDDEREWVPNPRQKDHPLPLPVDQALFDGWAAILSDLRKLVQGDEGLDVAELAQAGDEHWENPPRGFIDVGRLFDHPGDITFSTKQVTDVDIDEAARVEDLLRQIFGAAYVPTMKGTGLMRHLRRMRDEVQRGEESIERKLRYLLWLN